ncbi:YhcN/YlaJ family sporulation lipoprotein [Caldalkalibacillus uzonensis]|uniref:YhcN/YlaJ family sporulation lipoprotein n=1 Tax=Caldalkalibacillus uzonensis TaxID=353224 RepID=A0ABU0CRU6_9BACI|nr:YhcN/YlaJ family sporulation lipoprotein [Caldalkalibacillus uzonensis]MDQ0339144.1 YhcN/YlaJ family sporulation lipoprotein [Caldalkalibacillus uzonensis]
MRRCFQVLTLTLAITVLITACTPANPPGNQVTPESPDMRYQEAQRDRNQDRAFEGQTVRRDRVPTQDRNRVLENFDYTEAQETAERLAKLATRVDEVSDATAVVVGPWAVVGIDVDARLDRARVGSIKYSVAEALKEDPQGAYAVVTADPDTMQRLREMNRSIRRGEPVQGIMDELAEIVGRLMPQVPRDIEGPETPPEQDEDFEDPDQHQDINRLESEMNRQSRR